MADNNGNSRLALSGEAFRNELEARNLYSPDNQYVTSSSLSKMNDVTVASSLSSILNVIPQYANHTSGLVNNLTHPTPLTAIATQMLAQQFLYTSASHLAQQNLPAINLANVFDGNKSTHLFTKNINLSITDKKNNTLLDKIGGFVSKSFFNTNAIGNNYPFSENSTNATYIANTGKGQLNFFYTSINRNVYKQIGTDPSSSTIIEFGTIAKNPVQPRNNITSNNIYFDFNDSNTYKYLKKPSNVFTESASKYANTDERTSLSWLTKSNTIQEYAPDNQFVHDNFGTANKSMPKEDIYNFVDDKSDITTDDITNKLVWGRDGISSDSSGYLTPLHGNTDAETSSLNNSASPIVDDYRIHGGLLEYTRNLLNASSGYFVDITRKAFKEGNEIIGFNGSPLWQANKSTYAVKNQIAGKTGVRQHSMVDQYDRFAKAIRFNGNQVYGGNPNSVIFKSVIPRIHPTLDTDDQGRAVLNNKNLMFSLENLAITAIKRDTYGVIDDEWGSAIPLSEVGPFNGRIMWFPPYALELNETASAKYESTVMVGRNEPMYNYMNSERTAQLNFTLLVDYPEQLRNYIDKDQNKNKVIADFFAFGGNPLVPEKQIEELTLYIKQLEDKIPKETTPVKQAEPNWKSVPAVTVFFINDMPTESQVDGVIDLMYKNTNHYEIIEGCLSAQDGNGFGLNKDIYYRTGLTKTTTGYTLTNDNFSQYSSGKLTDQFGDCLLNKNLSDVFSDESTRKYYSITIDGGSSKLYLGKDEAAYNKALGQRRIAAAKKLVSSRLKAIFPTMNDSEIQSLFVIKTSAGSAGGSAVGATATGMSLQNVKQERRATITIGRNSVPVEDKKQTLNQDQQKNIIKIQQDIQAATRRLYELKNNISGQDNVFLTREDAILKGYDSVSKNNFYPVFHSQTPEEFHRRLTFLQQCTRQGAAKHFAPEVDETGTLRAKNSVFGKQPICIMRIGDFMYTKVIIENVTVDYNETTWDMNPEGFGMQPMIAKVTLQMKIIGGQSLEGPVDALQNAVSFNYYANSTYSDSGMYALPTKVARAQQSYISGILTDTSNKLTAAYNAIHDQNKK